MNNFEELITEIPVYWNKIKRSDVEKDYINPAHYKMWWIEPIDYIEANDLDFLQGNIIKYVTRARFKNWLEDLKKAKWYLERLIKREENNLISGRNDTMTIWGFPATLL